MLKDILVSHINSLKPALTNFSPFYPMNRLIRFFSITLLFVSIAFGTIGGCGGGGDGGGAVNGDGEVSCESPALNTDFSDTGVFFVDSDNAVLIGITSDGEAVSILLSDIPFSGAFIGVAGIPLSATVCDIVAGLIDVDGDLDFTDELLLAATGECRLQNMFSEIVIEDLVIIGVPLGVDLHGECDEVVPFNEANNNLNVLSNIMMDKLDEMADSESDLSTIEKRSSELVDEYIIFDFHEDILQNQE